MSTPPSTIPDSCNCGFSSPVNERTITLIISNVVWAVFFIISEVLGARKNSKFHSLVDFLKDRWNTENIESTTESGSLIDIDLGNIDDIRPRRERIITTTTDHVRAVNPDNISPEDREWQAYKDWRDKREFRQYLADRNTLNNSYRKPTPVILVTSENIDQEMGAGSSQSSRKRTPSNDGYDK